MGGENGDAGDQCGGQGTDEYRDKVRHRFPQLFYASTEPPRSLATDSQTLKLLAVENGNNESPGTKQ